LDVAVIYTQVQSRSTALTCSVDECGHGFPPVPAALLPLVGLGATRSRGRDHVRMLVEDFCAAGEPSRLFLGAQDERGPRRVDPRNRQVALEHVPVEAPGPTPGSLVVAGGSGFDEATDRSPSMSSSAGSVMTSRCDSSFRPMAIPVHFVFDVVPTLVAGSSVFTAGARGPQRQMVEQRISRRGRP
jgi:hypothetical protein